MNEAMQCGDYPREDDLQRITEWDWHDFEGLMLFIRPYWSRHGKFSHTGRDYDLETGGWSGNEQIIEALAQNAIFWGCCWQKSERGGHHVFTLPPKTEKDAQ